MSEQILPVQKIVEGALLAAGKPLNLEQLAQLFDEHERPDKPALKQVMSELAASCEGRGFELKLVASGYRIQVRQELSHWVGRLWEERPQRYTRALLETLALVAYRQPITRGEIEDVRGVSVSSSIVRTLQEREWVRVVGHRDVPGRPAMYATTRQFLDYFNLRNLDELPPLAEIRNLEEMARNLEQVGGQPELEGLEPDGQASGDGVTRELGVTDQISPVQQQFKEQSEEEMKRLFSELDDMESGLKTGYSDYDPHTEECPPAEVVQSGKTERNDAVVEPDEHKEPVDTALDDAPEAAS